MTAQGITPQSDRQPKDCRSVAHSVHGIMRKLQPQTDNQERDRAPGAVKIDMGTLAVYNPPAVSQQKENVMTVDPGRYGANIGRCPAKGGQTNQEERQPPNRPPAS